MPFGLKIGGRKKRYNVLSKNRFVIRIQLLNNNETELTLSVESTGLDCLEAVAGRLELKETHYFGLWFLGKAQQTRWVELEKSLKKQLDKFAIEPLLYFGVMFYVPNVSHLMQRATRFQYYLQLKKYVLDGHLRCTAEQYKRLAGLAIQIEFGDYGRFENPDFREYILFPVGWPQDEAFLGDLINKIGLEHKALCGMPQEEAEILYIKEAEHLEGYGQECFRVKDNHGNDINLCTFFMGIFVRNGQSAVTYRWNDIGNITHNKSAVVLELNRKEETVLFHTDDIENSKYISRLFAAMHKFYKENKICTEQSSSPPPVRRQPTWNRSSLSRPPSNIIPSRLVQGGETYISEDNIFHVNEDGFNYRSQTSLDTYPLEVNFLNGTLPNGSVSSAHSMNSLNRSQNVIQASPMSSNLSITGSDIMRVDHIPNYRHSAIILPSYRPTPDYDTVMRQMNRGIVPKDSQSQSLRNLNIGNTYAYRHQENLVYSQPEIQERHRYVAAYGPQTSYTNKLINQSEQTAINPTTNQASAKSISHTVSTPELANVPPKPSQSCSAAHMLRNFLSRPPPPYPPPRPASSTPDLASHRHKYVSSSSPDLVARKVQQSVKTFQEDSSPVVHQSLQEVSEPLMMGKHHQVHKRHSFEVITSMVRGMEAMALKTLNAPLPRRNTLREQVYTEEQMQKTHELQQLPLYHHKKTCSDATMLIHSSDSEEDEDAHKAVHYTSSVPGITYSAQLQAALARIPNKPPPEYPGPRKCISNGALRHDPSIISAAIARAKAMSPRPTQTACTSRTEQAAMNASNLGPSISEPDLTSVKERVKKEPVKERPVSEMFSIEDVIVEREIMMRNLKKQEMAAPEAQKRPLMLAALNGLSVSRIPVPEDRLDDTAMVPMDERCKTLRRKLEEGMVFTEYEQIPKRKADGVFTTATLPGNLELNRVREVIPYEENRVELVPTKENPTGYINASHIKMAVSGKEWHYIATQAPLPHTFHDFWQMVWEQGVNVVAMVTAEEEEGRAKNHRYWPKLGSRHSATYGKFKVTTNFRTDSGCYATTGLKVKHLLSDQERTVWHLQFTDWPRHGCPEEVQGFLSYLEEIQSVRRHANSMVDTSNPCNPPIVVHCSAGVGRTGVVILTELMIRCLEHNEKTEIPEMLKQLREQRMFMIQTIAQYKFVYQVLIQFLERSRLI